MARINLRDYYPWYQEDEFVDVSEDTAAFLNEMNRAESAYIRRLYWNKAHYSLDRNDGIDNALLNRPADPLEEYETKTRLNELYAAISKLPDKQAKRINAHYIMGLSKAEIARAEGVAEQSIGVTITRGIRKLKKFLKL
jgi:RNA polymerase sigma-70 factor (ECF subfamily)